MRTLLVLCLLAGSALSAEQAGEGKPGMAKVDFSYAFATPHRMCVARPDCSDKTLLDLEPGFLKLSWTYDSLMSLPVAAFVTPPALWAVKLTPRLGEKPFPQSTWTRAEGYLPVLDNSYTSPEGTMRLEVVGGETAAIVRVTMSNTSGAEAAFSLLCESQRGFFGYNPAYVDSDADRDCLLAGWGDRADRIIVQAVGADEYVIGGPTTLCPTWKVKPGETRVGWLQRPYRGYSADLPALRAHDWKAELEKAEQEWRVLIGRTVRILVPDENVVNGFYACLGDLFIMREPVPGGYIAGTPGTDGYRAANPGETAIVAVALDQLGLHKNAASGFQMCLDQQGDDGNWADPKGWAHLFWGASGFKAWAAMEHYRLTGDREYLADVFPKMLASSRWQETQRARTRVMKGAERPLTYGLMPRGMGDCGLKDGEDLYGVFLPHNIWCVFADRMSLEAAQVLGLVAETEELRAIHATAQADLLKALDAGAIVEKDYRWIPGVPGKTCGSRWGALNALFPCGILPRDHDLITGTLRQIRSRMSPGGLPVNTGWMIDGMWVAISLDNLAEVHLVRDEGDEAADLFYATLNHGTPLFTWCEERGQQPGAKETTGDRQHLWTPVAVVRALRDSLVMEDGTTLHLGRGIHRDWLGSGKPVGIANAPTYFGLVTYRMQYDAAAHRVTGKATFEEGPTPTAKLESAVLHLRLPQGVKVASVNPESKATVLPDGSGIQWQAPKSEVTFEAKVE